MITQTTSQCRFCGAQNSIITDIPSGTIVCTNCGVVLEDRIIDEQNEARADTDAKGNPTSRLGGPIDYSFFDEISNGVSIVSKKNKSLRSRKFNQGNSALNQIFSHAEYLGNVLGISKMNIDCSRSILYTLMKENKIKGKNRDNVIAIVFFKVLYKNNRQKPLREIAMKLGLEINDLKKTYMAIKDYLLDETKEKNASMVQFEGNARLITSKLTLSKEVLKAIRDVGEVFIKKEIFTGKNPGTVAAAVIYFVCQMYGVKEGTLQLLEKCSGIKEKTIKGTFLTMIDYKNIIPEEYKSLCDKIVRKSSY